MILSTKELRGGARENAGRKPLEEDEKRVKISTTVSSETLRKMKRIDCKKGRAIDEAVHFYFQKKQKEVKKKWKKKK